MLFMSQIRHRDAGRGGASPSGYTPAPSSIGTLGPKKRSGMEKLAAGNCGYGKVRQTGLPHLTIQDDPDQKSMHPKAVSGS